MSRKSNISSRSKSTDPADAIGSNTVRKARRVSSKNLKSIDRVEDRKERIAVSAYYKAGKRGFKNGDETQDWLEAEATVDRLYNMTNK